MKALWKNCFVGLASITVFTIVMGSMAHAQVASAKAKATGQVSGFTGRGNNDEEGNEEQEMLGPNVRMNMDATTSRSISLMEDGRKISISQNSSGIKVTVDGQSVRAANEEELKRKNPEAYRLYEKHLSGVNAKASARGSAGGFAGGGAGGSAGGAANGLARSTRNAQGRSGSNQRPGNNRLMNRSVTLDDNGKKISITENRSGITVSVDGKTVRARNAADLKKKNPEAYDLYDQHLLSSSSNSSSNPNPTASDILRSELKDLRSQHANDPQMRQLFDMMLKEIDNQP